VCVPSTWNNVPTPPGCVTVPTEFGEPSPQSMLAVKSLIVPNGFASANRIRSKFVSVVPSEVAIAVALETEMGASAMTAEAVVVVT